PTSRASPPTTSSAPSSSASRCRAQGARPPARPCRDGPLAPPGGAQLAAPVPAGRQPGHVLLQQVAALHQVLARLVEALAVAGEVAVAFLERQARVAELAALGPGAREGDVRPRQVGEHAF